MEFEKSLNRLEEIKELLENPDIKLDEAVRLYEEGVGHSKECILSMKEISGKISKINCELDEAFEEPLDIKED